MVFGTRSVTCLWHVVYFLVSGKSPPSTFPSPIHLERLGPTLSSGTSFSWKPRTLGQARSRLPAREHGGQHVPPRGWVPCGGVAEFQVGETTALAGSCVLWADVC